jgi:hypothetical protein
MQLQLMSVVEETKARQNDILSQIHQTQQIQREHSNAFHASNAAYGESKNHQILLDRGYSRDEQLSNKHASIYYNPYEKHTILAYRGTQLTDPEDLKADLDIAANTQHNNVAFKTARSLYETTFKKYNNPITITGHSLGGSKALNVASTYKTKAITFNPGISAFGQDIGDSFVYHKQGDIVSSRFRGKKENINVSSGGHSLSTFKKF